MSDDFDLQEEEWAWLEQNTPEPEPYPVPQEILDQWEKEAADQGAFFKRLQSGDPLQMVLGGALFIELHLKYLLQEHLPKLTDREVTDRLSLLHIPQVTLLLKGLGVISGDARRSFLTLHQLRNEVAHHFEAPLNPNTVEDLKQKTDRLGMDTIQQLKIQDPVQLTLGRTLVSLWYYLAEITESTISFEVPAEIQDLFEDEES